MIVLDASVLIGFLETVDLHHAAATALILGVGTEPLGINSLTLAEALVGPAKQSRLEVAADVIQRLGVREIPFPDDTAKRLAELRALTSIKMPDCCSLLAAQQTGARLATFDARLARAAATVGISVVDVV